MDSSIIRPERALPIDATLLRVVLHRMRRDVAAPELRWSLGDRGWAELDVHFMPVITPTSAGPTWTSTMRLWDPDRLALAIVAVEITARDAATCDLTLCAHGPLDPSWNGRMATLQALARAALDELGEELLWHATREDVAHV